MMTKHTAISSQHSATSDLRSARTNALSRAFTLVEVLLAIFILGIGVISIAALFPAGIAQQRLSVDDMNGPAVANNAIEIIRSKVSRDDFGIFEEFDDPGNPSIVVSPRPTVYGDWTWLRPSTLFGSDPDTVTAPPGTFVSVDYDDTGSIDIFSWYATGSPAQPITEFPTGYGGTDPILRGIPYNTVRYGSVPPRIVIPQRERFYPTAPRMYTERSEPARPQYVWDCAFRRFQGKILVAIFVYRVTVPGGGSAIDYKVAQPLPYRLSFIGDGPAYPVTNTAFSAGGPWDAQPPIGNTNPAVVLGVEDNLRYNPDNANHAWQQPRQWIIDQNNNVHRVVGQSRTNEQTSAGDMQVELSRRLSPVLGLVDTSGNSVPTSTHYFYRPASTNAADGYGWIEEDIVTDIWYIPLTDSNGLILTPVYATVKEL